AIEEGVEDVHSQVEMMLTNKLGDIGKKVHSGRSRNDQVLVDLKLHTREEIQKIAFATKELFDLLLSLSDHHKEDLLPGYTHLQVAMPSSFGLWFGAYAESLADDLLLLQAAYKITNQNPLGSAAGYGSSFPLNRQMTTDLLGFDNMNYNVVYAQMSRGKTEKITAYALASIAATFSRMAMDICLFMNQNFGFISFPDHLTTGSSIMPHKKNPDVFELIRAKGNKLQLLPADITAVTINLPSGYHRDMQLIKEFIMPAFAEIQECLAILTYMMQHVNVKKNILENEKYKFLFSVEEVNKLVLQGVPFRDAYKQVGFSIEENDFNPDKSVHHVHEGSIGNLCNESIKERMEKILEGFEFMKVQEAIEKLLGQEKENKQ
ncbi:MAG: argininosuccinate lyase, partial [Bacteroidota bacterium]